MSRKELKDSSNEISMYNSYQDKFHVTHFMLKDSKVDLANSAGADLDTLNNDLNPLSKEVSIEDYPQIKKNLAGSR